MQALHQHHLATYLALLTGTQVDTTVLPQPSVARSKTARLVKRIGSIDTALQRMRGRLAYSAASGRALAST